MPGAFQPNAFQNNAFQVQTSPPVVSTASPTGLISNTGTMMNRRGG